jgi:REP element-mobilizing transposase RayT
MTLFKNKYRIESARLQEYDYSSPGAYFITICTKNRECFFGEIADAQMILNNFGKIVLDCWHDLPNHYANIMLNALVIMPNHIHGIIIIVETGIVQTGLKPVSTTGTVKPDKKNNHGLSEFVRALKSFSSRRINTNRQTPGYQVWQSRFHERIIRNEHELHKIREYIINNPLNWEQDENNI